MDCMRFSILIPVYNVEKYVEQCLESVLSQSFRDFEVILVNDGSTDQSSTICEKYVEIDSRVKYYDKKNEGLLRTRRFQILQASGEYVLFLDSDDYWEPGILFELNNEIESTQADMICYRFRRITDDGRIISEDTGIFTNRAVFNKNNKEEFLEEFVKSPRLNPLWTKCVKNSIIDKDTDYSAYGDKKGEDLLQSIALIRNADLILYLDEVFVNYRQTPYGRGRRFQIKYIDDYEIVKNHIYTYLNDMNVSANVMHVFYIKYIEGLMSYLGLIVNNSQNLACFINICKRVDSFTLFQMIRKTIQPEAINRIYRMDYINMMKHRYFVIYSFYSAKKILKKCLFH